MDKLEKALRKLTEFERKTVEELLKKLHSGTVQGLNVKKLKGHSNIFRVRKGNLRIIYRVTEGDISLLTIDRRSEKTYKDF